MGYIVYGEHPEADQPYTTWSQAGDTWGCFGVDDRTEEEVLGDMARIKSDREFGLALLVGGAVVLGGIGYGLYKLIEYLT